MIYVKALILFGLITIVLCDKFSDLTAQLWKHTKGSGENAKSSDIIPESDIRAPNRNIWIVTTACLPWMTGTSINPLLRAAHLAKNRPDGTVHLMVPWLNKDEQHIAFGRNIHFNHPDEQREYVKKWLIKDAHMPGAARKLQISFYAARYHDEYHSIFPMGDVTALIPDEEADVCVLEEPEHLNWYKAPFTAKTWMDKFRHVVGIIHTNYLSYTRAYTLGQIKEPLLYYVNQAVVRAYCHKIIKLSGALQEFAAEKEIISNVHGVRSKYLEIGDSMAARKFSKGAYFVGKLAWAKGLSELFTLMEYVKTRTNQHFHIDIFGGGPHEEEIKLESTKRDLSTAFFGPKDHSLLTDYKVFVNPSLSEVLCTTIVEALAMGKWVVCAKHPSNEFFEQFPNCLTFRNEEEFAANMFWALNNDPRPLTREQRYTLTWEAAMERFEEASRLTVEEQNNSKVYTDKMMAWIIEAIGSGSHGDSMRFLFGGRSASNQIDYIKKYGSADPTKNLAEKEDDTEAPTAAAAGKNQAQQSSAAEAEIEAIAAAIEEEKGEEDIVGTTKVMEESLIEQVVADDASTIAATKFLDKAAAAAQKAQDLQVEIEADVRDT